MEFVVVQRVAGDKFASSNSTSPRRCYLPSSADAGTDWRMHLT